uniref:Uncharacterized protein n=1 Tax=Rhizophora mucronata TaxID=61149 RepID=A0A2P2NC36_RHIMU
MKYTKNHFRFSSLELFGIMKHSTSSEIIIKL